MGGTDKLTLALEGRPLIVHSAATLLDWPPLAGMAVTVTPGREAELEQIFARFLPTEQLQRLHLLAGGKERQDSVRLGLEALKSRFGPQAGDPVLIHDAARPFVDVALFESLLRALQGCDGSLPATPVRDTVKRVDGRHVVRTEDRETLRMVQTPQVFRFAAILELHRRAHQEEYLGTDDASLVEHYGGKVSWIPGPAHNLKVTVPEDLALLSELVRARSRAATSS
jgi:2-C-methyl-D-erythritol 4-phosphate cytidylyltransferase